jgi:hypothetical protein
MPCRFLQALSTIDNFNDILCFCIQRSRAYVISLPWFLAWWGEQSQARDNYVDEATGYLLVQCKYMTPFSQI